jgi:membrane protein DedA with SNARE-associated domain
MGDVLAWFGDVFTGFNEWLGDTITWLLAVVQEVDPVARTLLAGVGILLETTLLVGLVVPGDTIVIIAATGVDNPAQFFALVVVVIVGALCGESIGFALGRYFGPRIRRSRLGGWIGERNWTRAENYLDRRGGIAVFISRFLPVLHSLIPLTVGASTMRYRTFMAWTLPASTIWAFAYVSVGTFAAGSYRELSQRLHGAGYIFIAVVVAFVITVSIVKKMVGKEESRFMTEPGDGDANTIDDPR